MPEDRIYWHDIDGTDKVLVIERNGPWRVYTHGLKVDAWYEPSRDEVMGFICWINRKSQTRKGR